MILRSLYLQNFRNYTKSKFVFEKGINIVVGQNASGKTNLLEAIFLLSVGKSFKAEKDDQMIKFGEQVGRAEGVAGSFFDIDEDIELKAVINNLHGLTQKRFFVNGVAKRRNNFAGNLANVPFFPTDLDIVIGYPSARRRYLDDVLEQVDSEYSLALTSYTKALRQRNALLVQVREKGFRDSKAFNYWDFLLIKNGQIIAEKREKYISFINRREKGLFEFQTDYDRSEISKERLEQYKNAEAGAGVTLVGPHRDDLKFLISKGEARQFASRGQQRLVVLELKLSQITYIEERTGERPVLLLDDIFSELDGKHIKHILEILPNYQVIITTTHKEFVEGLPLREGNVIELNKM